MCESPFFRPIFFNENIENKNDQEAILQASKYICIFNVLNTRITNNKNKILKVKRIARLLRPGSIISVGFKTMKS